MNGRAFPFWIVSQRRGMVLKPIEAQGMPGIIAAFDSAEDAATFMTRRGEQTWENRLISRATLNEIKEGFSELGFRGFYFDLGPRKNGREIAFDQLLKTYSGVG